MYVCPQCATTVDSAAVKNRRDTCPNCGAVLRDKGDPPWTDVARVRNLAEAGFLSDELHGLGIDARIHQMDEFSAVTDRWASLYLIRVPTLMAGEAAAQIRRHLLEADAERESETATFSVTDHDHSADPLLWRPVAIVVLAGVASFVLGQRFSDQKEHRVERRPPRNSLAAAVEAIGRPFVSESAGGQTRHRLSFDRRRDAWFLDLDRNGDGRYDSRQAFHASGAAW
jgi:hypothetical protein